MASGSLRSCFTSFRWRVTRRKAVGMDVEVAALRHLEQPQDVDRLAGEEFRRRHVEAVALDGEALDLAPAKADAGDGEAGSLRKGRR